uniref:Uncharacterized protein n=1 Tax=Pipistrellus kuhlii TaxID=59472 RepID=A0A7J7WLF0_PIPKU|nr:hypothetical protein mPipKuh1_007928 [Pipistrellus kuhlii]
MCLRPERASPAVRAWPSVHRAELHRDFLLPCTRKKKKKKIGEKEAGGAARPPPNPNPGAPRASTKLTPAPRPLPPSFRAALLLVTFQSRTDAGRAARQQQVQKPDVPDAEVPTSSIQLVEKSGSVLSPGLTTTPFPVLCG